MADKNGAGQYDSREAEDRNVVVAAATSGLVSLAIPISSSSLPDNHGGRELSTSKRLSFRVLGQLGGIVSEPEFYLFFTEGFEAGEPRFCTVRKKVMLGNTGELGLLVSVSPPLKGGQYTDSDEDIDLLILSARLLGRTLFPIDEWPFYVRVFVPLQKDPESYDLFQKDDLALVAFGKLLQSVKSGGSETKSDAASSIEESAKSPAAQITFFPEEGTVQSSLKEKLAKCCDAGMATKAFLVPISYGHSSYRQLALCVSGAELRAEELVRCVRETRTVETRSNLDVVFLTETQVLEVSLVATPFYERGD